MAEEIDFENGRNSNFEGLVTLTLTFDPAIRHIILQQSSTSTYIPTFIRNFLWTDGRTDGRTYGRTYGRADGHFPLYIIRSTFGSPPKKLENLVHSFFAYWHIDRVCQFCENHIKNCRKTSNSIKKFDDIQPAAEQKICHDFGVAWPLALCILHGSVAQR